MRGCSGVAWDADAAALGSIAPSLPRREGKKQGVVVIPHKLEEKRTREKGMAGREGGRFPAQHCLFSHTSAWIQYMAYGAGKRMGITVS